MSLFLSFNNLIKQLNGLFHCSKRNFSLHLIPDMNKYASREAKFMNKLVGITKKKRNVYFEATTIPAHGGKFNFGNNLKNNKENSRRIAVLNSLFMKYISDLLVNGNIAEEILGKGLEISRVAMCSNFRQLNVFWGTTKAENATVLEEILPDVGFALRHELSQLQVMGVVPRIVFTKDKHYDAAIKVDYLLSIADYGEDHVPLPLGAEFKNAPIVESTNLNAPKCITKDVENNDEGNVSAEVTQVDEQMPLMRQDIFNLNHDRIMEKVVKLLQKSRALHRFQPNLELECEGARHNLSQVPVDKMTKQERKDALSRFILERKVLQEKQKQNKYNSELNIINDLRESDEDDDIDSEDFQTEDFIEENFEEENVYREK